MAVRVKDIACTLTGFGLTKRLNEEAFDES
jgi:hypothetical protein